ncbi:hypothetical protein F0U60_31705 [Archangium minus]|uniref:TolA protein n=1 Tax=Archangium minus TaxID=83450 RepID=A0ABY9WYK3_9BACT|nr:hypothetical protein F0U60_31705 [Archangium minus]
MSPQRISGSGNGAEAARQAAEAARKAAEEAARKAAAEAARKAAEASAQQQRSGFQQGARQNGLRLDGGTQAPASTLLTENNKDGQANCLDVAADWVEKASPELRARSELVFLKDTRPGAEGQSGHVVVRQGQRILDPSSGKSYEDMAAFRQARPEYKEVGTLQASQAARIFAAAPGSPERAEAIKRARVPESLQQMLVADVATTPRALNPESVRKAEEDFKLLEKAHHLGQPHLAAELLQQHAGDADYQAHLIGLMNKGGAESMLNNVVAGFEGLFIKAGTGEFRGEPEQRQALLTALGHAREAGTFTDADMQAYLSRAPAPWGEVKNALGVSTVSRASNADAAVRELNEASEAYEEAKADAAKLDEELAKQLSGFGPALTDKQRADYIKAFQEHPDNQRVYQELEQTAQRLADVVQRNEGALFNAAITRPDRDATALNKALELLATSPKAQVALEVGGRIVQDPSSTLAQTFKAFPDFESKVVQAAIPNAAADILAQVDKPEDGLKQLQSLLEPFKIAFADTDGAKGDIEDGLAAMDEMVRTNNFDRLRQLADNWETGSGWSKALASAAVAFGAVAAVNAGREGEYGTMIKEIASASKGGLTMLAGATESLAQAGKFARFGVDAGAQASRFASFAARLAPALGLVASATSFGLRVGDLKDDPNAGKVIALLGDALGVLGASIELIPGGQPVGLVVSGIAAGITALGEGISWLWEKGEFEAQRREFLDKAGVKDPLRQTLLDADGERVMELVNELKLSPERLQDLAKQHPWLLTEGSNNGLSLDNFVKMAKDFGLEGEKAFQLLSTMGAGHEDPAHSTYVVLANIMRQGNFRSGRGEWLELLGQLRRELPAEHRATIDAMERALRSASGGGGGGQPARAA